MNQQAKLNVLLNLKDQATAGLKRATRSVKDHQAAFRKASLLMAGAAGVLGAALFASARAGREQEQAIRSASVNVEATGTTWAEVAEEVTDASRELADNTNFSFAEVMDTYATLVGMTGNWREALKLLEPTLDVQTEKGNDLAGAARNVVRFVRDAAGEMKEVYYPTLSDTSTETERLALLTKDFGDNARGNVDPVSALGSAFTDLLASLGIAPIIDTAAKSLKGFANTIRDAIPEWAAPLIGGTLVAAFLAFTAGAGLAAIAATGFGVALIGATVAAAPFIAIGAGIALAVGGIILGILLLRKHWEEVWGFIKSTFATISGFLSDAYRSKWGWLLPGGPLIKAILFIKDQWDTIWNAIKWTYTTVTDAMKSATTGVIDFLKAGWEGLYGAVKGVINRIIGVVNTMIKGVNQISFDMPFGGPKIGFNLPEITPLAAGGIVRRPTVGLLGERGPEAVIPLGGRGGLGGNVVINFPASGTVILDSESSARRLATELTRLIRGELRSQRGW